MQSETQIIVSKRITFLRKQRNVLLAALSNREINYAPADVDKGLFKKIKLVPSKEVEEVPGLIGLIAEENIKKG